MAKKQSFVDKTGKKKGTGKDHIKLIRTARSMQSGALHFYEEMVRIPEGNNADGIVKKLLEKEA